MTLAALLGAQAIQPGAVSAADLPLASVEPVAPVPLPNWILVANNQLNLSFSGRHIDYGEYGNARYGEPTGIIDSERGWVPGLSLSGTFMRDYFLTNMYFSGEFSWNKGKTLYLGSDSGLPTDYGTLRQKHNAEMFDFDFRIGKGFDVGSRVMVTSYVGAGSRYWDRDFHKFVGGYREEYSHGYAGGGILLQIVPFDRLVVSANGFVGSTFDSFLAVSKQYSGKAPFSFNLGNSLTYRLGVAGDYALTDRVHLTAAFDYVAFDYGRSVNLAAQAVEPDSRTADMRFKIGLGYSFY